MKKLLSLIALATLSAQSAGAMFPDDPTLDEVSRFCTHYGLNKLDLRDGETFAEQIFTQELKKRKHDVPGLYYTAAFFYYNKRRVEGEFQLLEDMFQMMPQEHREKMWTTLNAWAAQQSPGPMLCEFPDLKERLLTLPFDPKLPFQIV